MDLKEKNEYNQRAKEIKAKREEEKEAALAGLSRRQRELLEAKEEKERKEKEKGPAWYYVLEPVKEPKVKQEPEDPNRMVGQVVSSRCCVRCEEANGEVVLKCRSCWTHYHATCLGMAPSQKEENFRCTECQVNRHACFLCKKVGDEAAVKREEEEVQEVEKGPILPPPRRCSVSQCGRYYHDSCLTATPLWPQAKLQPLVCPAHTCHTCASDNPRDPVMKHGGQLSRCVRCPTAYHYGDTCVAAGTVQVTRADIICHKHWQPSKNKKKGQTGRVININWCFDCGKGGSLICCELCPMSVHPECTNKSKYKEGNKYYCDNCTDGKMPLYNDLVWVKLGAYRWWPSKVVHPVNLPPNIEKLSHQDGEFPIQFLGSGEYYWINHGRAFLYDEGDCEKMPNLSNKSMDKAFSRGLAEAEELWKELETTKSKREEKSKNSKQSPPPYVQLKTNKVVGDADQFTTPSEAQECDCNPHKDSPCGEDSNCMNR